MYTHRLEGRRDTKIDTYGARGERKRGWTHRQTETANVNIVIYSDKLDAAGSSRITVTQIQTETLG